MENAGKDQKILTTFQRGKRMTHKKWKMGHASYESLVSLHRVKRPETHRETGRKRPVVKVLKEVSSEGEDEKEEVERKIIALQRIVPGGESLGIERLFEETAGYIQALQGQLRAMTVIANFFEGLENEKRKCGR